MQQAATRAAFCFNLYFIYLTVSYILLLYVYLLNMLLTGLQVGYSQQDGDKSGIFSSLLSVLKGLRST